MAEKFIPDGDSNFASRARTFCSRLEQDPIRYGVSADEVQELVAKVTAFRDAMAANYNPMTTCKASRLHKDETRAAAAQIIRDLANRIRNNRKISAADKCAIYVKERPTRLRRRECPQTPPVMQFVGSTPACNALEGKHIIKFFDDYGKKSLAKPDGAVRLELFVDLVPPGEPIPRWPGERWGGRMWYLRSYTRSPIEVEYPKCDELMRVVYWARWAGPNGETGPFSQTLATRVAGFDKPIKMQPALGGNRPATQSVIITTVRRDAPALTDETTAGEEHSAVKLIGTDVAEAA